ncbi:hypothetical protein C7S20_09130 [Christiangramia fulva]|uniref:Uncharacterized protein n=2 Tax=Christiangramia fulva TaxID=2126553 RepID=A0A2R3Z578_9FLAO|nr:hypothetical protein C7S20_09130 [Christiangramia fulva]
MIKLLKNIRMKSLKENSFTRYVIYAIGEIILVVIGILIALQVNNWNENQKKNVLKKQYLSSLISDTIKDTIVLKDNIKSIEGDLSLITSFKNRLSKSTSTLDTVRHIARYEYLPFFDPSNELNRNTITSLLSTGDLNLFDKEIQNTILTHNTIQLALLKVMDKNVDIFFSANANGGLFSSSNPSLDNAMIRGHLMDSIWQNKDGIEVLEVLNNRIASKILMYTFISGAKKTVTG